MKLATCRRNGTEESFLVTPGGAIPVRAISRHCRRDWPADFLGLVSGGAFAELQAWHRQATAADWSALAPQSLPPASLAPAPLLRRPRKIWGIGLNYRAHAADLAENAPTAEPASFMKPDTALVGPGDAIRIPRLSARTTGEAELALVIGRQCRDVPRENWRDVLAGFVAIIDMTAEDILRRNPRNLTQSKSFDTFVAVDSTLLTPDEVPDVNALTVRTVHNGRIHAENTVARMTFTPDSLVCYHSQIMTLLPGDLILTGTPGAAVLGHGDTIACQIDGFPVLRNPVIDEKNPA